MNHGAPTAGFRAHQPFEHVSGRARVSARAVSVHHVTFTVLKTKNNIQGYVKVTFDFN